MHGKILTLLAALASFLCASMPVFADGLPEKQVPGIDETRDSLSLESLRDYLSMIREKRPTVALVLSGGGAKGASHIGVIKCLDSLGIPVDVVLGTSMGGLIGSLYSLGYQPEQMDSILRSFDWYVESMAENIQYAGTERKYDQIHFGAAKGEDATRVVRDNLLGSLPSGFAFGQNVNNIFSSLTVGYQDNMSFEELPIPFVCVATEMVTAKPKIWYEGKLNTALRSTMSIPGVFAPVRTDGMVLVDGGMRDNYPTDIAKAMGADIIIGVDLSSGFRDYSGLNNLGDIISQGVDMLGRESYEKNVGIPDVTIKPSLDEFTMMSFDDRSISTIIDRGYEAALTQIDKLDSLKALIGPFRTELHNRRAIDINSEPVRISSVEITGVSDKESR